MFDCLTVCNSACISCIWCILFSTCFPHLINVKDVDSSECSSWRRPKAEKQKISRIVQCCLSSTEALVYHRSRGAGLATEKPQNCKYRVEIKGETSTEGSNG